MDDLISRQAAIDAIGALSDTIFKNIEKGATYPPRAWFAGMANAESIIKDLPSIDAVQVIRCRDCKHYAGEGKRCDWDICVQVDRFYCYYGERKES